jgi:phosphocarrier protein FPr
MVFEQKQDQLLSANSEQLLAMFATSSEEIVAEVSADNTAVFTIKNAHGLHARPGAMLVSEAKKYESKITVLNLNGDGKSANAKSLMKVIALGVKHCHELQFTADGVDAKEALVGIGAAIESGLGEG